MSSIPRIRLLPALLPALLAALMSAPLAYAEAVPAPTVLTTDDPDIKALQRELAAAFGAQAGLTVIGHLDPKEKGAAGLRAVVAQSPNDPIPALFWRIASGSSVYWLHGPLVSADGHNLTDEANRSWAQATGGAQSVAAAPGSLSAILGKVTLPEGAPDPEQILKLVENERVSAVMDNAPHKGAPVIYMFVAPNCGYCQTLAADVAAMREQPGTYPGFSVHWIPVLTGEEHLREASAVLVERTFPPRSANTIDIPPDVQRAVKANTLALFLATHRVATPLLAWRDHAGKPHMQFGAPSKDELTGIVRKMEQEAYPTNLSLDGPAPNLDVQGGTH